MLFYSFDPLFRRIFQNLLLGIELKFAAMTDRNERHFLEFHTPARRRIDRLTAVRRQTNVERQRTPFSDDKENPTNNGYGVAPATIAGEKASGIGRQRRRLFTRSASKQNTTCGEHGNYGGGFSSPLPSGSTLPRALFSTDVNVTPMAKTSSQFEFYSPPGSSKLLREYRAKQSLLSSSKTRTSSLSSPLSARALRLRPSSLWKKGRDPKINEENDNETSPISGKKENVKLDFKSPQNKASETIDEGTPSSKASPTTPKTKAKQSVFWSPPGTSKLLRKYRQRTQQLDQEPASYKSPPGASVISPTDYGRNQAHARGSKGLRLLDSGAKRCRPSTKAPNSKSRGSMKSSTKRNLLSPLTAKRLEKDIHSYRQAQGRDQSTTPLNLADNNSDSVDKIENEIIIEDGSNPNANEECMDNNPDGSLKISPSVHSPPTNTELAPATKDCTNNAVPFDEAENALTLAVLPSDSMQNDATEDALEKNARSSEVNDTNPSDEESGVFRSTRSATRARRQSMCDAEKSESLSNPLDIDKRIVNEKESGVFRSTRSATRARLKCTQDILEGGEPIDKTHKKIEDEGNRSLQSTRSVSPSTQNDAEAFPSVQVPEEESGVFRSTRSATRARRKALQDAVKVANNEDEDKSREVIRPSNSFTARPIDNIEIQGSLPSPRLVDDTPSPKGSLQSIWDAIHCVGSRDNSIDSSHSGNMCHSAVNTNIVSRVGDCVNPMAATLMNMWREEEKDAMDQNKDLSRTIEALPVCGLQSSPRKSFSSNLKLVYGLERVQNLTLARPMPLQATRSSTSLPEITIPPLAPSSQ